MPETEADTCRRLVLPKLYAAGWTDDQINEQYTFTGGRVIPNPRRIRRGRQKRADYRLRYTRDLRQSGRSDPGGEEAVCGVQAVK